MRSYRQKSEVVDCTVKNDIVTTTRAITGHVRCHKHYSIEINNSSDNITLTVVVILYTV